MAVFTPIFVLFVIGLIEFGRALMIKQAMTDAARAGSRTATLATTRSHNQVVDAARDFLACAISDPDEASVVVSPDDLSSTDRRVELTTTVSVSFSKLFWIVPNFLGDVVIKSESHTKRNEQDGSIPTTKELQIMPRPSPMWRRRDRICDGGTVPRHLRSGWH